MVNRTGSDEAPRAGASAFAGPPGGGLGFDDVPTAGATLMARHAAHFAAADATVGGIAPRLTWFTWDRPTVSLGRLESADGIDRDALAAAGIPLVVRPTGGRAVFHVDEWTYAAIVPLDQPRLGGSLAASTRALTAVIAAALAAAYGLRCDEPGDTRRPPGAATLAASATCFARSFGYELTVGGRTLMGCAQRRGRRVLLQQGSLLVGPGHERLARFLSAGGSSAEAALGEATTNLSALLGGRPDPAPFRRALAAAWTAVGADEAGSAPQGSGQSRRGPLDSPGEPS